jgi:hypothetical protein
VTTAKAQQRVERLVGGKTQSLGVQIAEWCLENMTLPDGLVKEIKDAMEIARKTIGQLGNSPGDSTD